jgi:hypothetical protein
MRAHCTTRNSFGRTRFFFTLGVANAGGDMPASARSKGDALPKNVAVRLVSHSVPAKGGG